MPNITWNGVLTEIGRLVDHACFQAQMTEQELVNLVKLTNLLPDLTPLVLFLLQKHRTRADRVNALVPLNNLDYRDDEIYPERFECEIGLYEEPDSTVTVLINGKERALGIVDIDQVTSSDDRIHIGAYVQAIEDPNAWITLPIERAQQCDRIITWSVSHLDLFKQKLNLALCHVDFQPEDNCDPDAPMEKHYLA